MREVIYISGFTPGPSDVINRDIEMARLRREVEALRAENSMHATDILCLRRDLAGKAATEVLERVAAAQSADPATDDLSVCLAIEVADLEAADASLRREKAALAEALTNLVEAMSDHGTVMHAYVWKAHIQARTVLRGGSLVELPPVLERFKERLSARLNDHLCEMKEGYDDSIVGFNEAWDVMRALFDDIEKERAALRSATENGEPT